MARLCRKLFPRESLRAGGGFLASRVSTATIRDRRCCGSTAASASWCRPMFFASAYYPRRLLECQCTPRRTFGAVVAKISAVRFLGVLNDE